MLNLIYYFTFLLFFFYTIRNYYINWGLNVLESLYLEAIKKKDSIQKEIEDFEQSDFDIDKFWNFTDIQESNDNFKIAAGDGSYSSRKFLAFNLYAVGAVSYIYNRNNGLDSIEKVDFNIAEHQ